VVAAEDVDIATVNDGIVGLEGGATASSSSNSPVRCWSARSAESSRGTMCSVVPGTISPPEPRREADRSVES
jgi:hypothetical protein